MTKILLLILLLGTTSVYAQLDLSLGGQARSYPAVGGEFTADMGYNWVFWGKGDKKNPMYGLIRPSIFGSSNVVINSYGGEIGFWPISFLGVERGFRNVVSNFEEFPFYECEEVRCTGTLNRQYTTFKMALGYGPIVALGRVQVSDNTYNDPDNEGKQVAEFRFATLANPEEDAHYHSQYVLGVKSQSLGGLVGVVKDYARFSESGQEYNSTFLAYMKRSGKHLYTYGIGNFETDHWENGTVIYFRWIYEALPTKRQF
jgi:hypothetical protein